jgi:hypothetical protein
MWDVIGDGASVHGRRLCGRRRDWRSVISDGCTSKGGGVMFMSGESSNN